MAAKKTTKSIPPKAAAAKPAEKASKTAPKADVAAKTSDAKLASAPNAKQHETHSFRRKLIGHVTSDKMDKTVVVEVSRYSLDRVYKKYVKHKAKYKAHDEQNEYKVGDRVEIMEHRPLSKEKRFKVVRLVARAALEARV